MDNFIKIKMCTAKILSTGLACVSLASISMAGVERRVFTEQSRNQIIKLEWLSDGLLHFEFTHGIHRKSNDPIYSSVMIKPQHHTGPTSFTASGESYLTPDMRVTYANGCFTAYDRIQQKHIAKICALNTAQTWKLLEVETADVKNVYGLGQLFGDAGSMVVDRNGKVNGTRGGYGNNMSNYAGGATGEALFPMVTALGTGSFAWGFVLDNVYKQTWDMTQAKWRIGMHGDQIRGFILTGATPAAVREKYMALTGKAPVPPRKMFGFWMSEYGYDNWDEINDRLAGMRRDGFPIDGFFLDLQWFGNVTGGSDHTRMGTLQFDERSFPNPEATIRNYKNNEDIALITIEESYVGRGLQEHDQLESQGFLAHECGRPNTASYLTGDVTGNTSEWWGRGGMIDWSNPAAGRYWHNTKRQHLVRMGIFAHWLDLGEPEMFDPSSCYYGNGEPGKVEHQDIHNLFSLLWAKSLWDGFGENNVGHRPFSMLRSGNMGLQRFGAGLWSGDIGGNLPSLSAHIASHAHMSWSGIDYYSSDIGGFHRNRADGQPLSHHETQEGFTQWFANAAWFDVPVRSHVMNLDNDRETAPNRIGHVESNRVNLLTRYSLVPYYYSLAHLAAQTGQPLMEPLPMRFPADMQIRRLGDQRMLGDLMMVAAAEASQYQKNAYLPAGTWYDFFDGTHKQSSGEWLNGIALYRDGLFRLPVFAKAGALVPRYSGHMNRKALGSENIKQVGKNMMLDVFVDEDATKHSFEMFEDDGYSRGQEKGQVRVTLLEQQTVDYTSKVKIFGAVGQFAGEENSRTWSVRLYSPHWSARNIEANGERIEKCSNPRMRSQCYELHGKSAVIIYLANEDVRKTQNISVSWTLGAPAKADIHFVCDEGRDSPRGHGMFVVGDDAALGAWNPDAAIPLKKAEFVRGVWSATLKGLETGRQLAWKCLRKIPGGGDRNVDWQPGNDNLFNVSEEGGFSGMAKARW